MASKSGFVDCSDSFMTSSAVALSVVNLAGLRLLCVITGLAGILLGLLFDRKVQRASHESHSDSVGPDSSHESSPAEFCGTQELIQLSNDSGPTKSSDMTQQQKIAAALTRAGIPNSVAWSRPASPRAASAVMDAPPEPPTAAHRIPNGVASQHSTLLRRIVLLTGSILFLLSLILFLAIR